jgi:hypothetical protein
MVLALIFGPKNFLFQDGLEFEPNNNKWNNRVGYK